MLNLMNSDCPTIEKKLITTQARQEFIKNSNIFFDKFDEGGVDGLREKFSFNGGEFTLRGGIALCEGGQRVAVLDLNSVTLREGENVATFGSGFADYLEHKFVLIASGCHSYYVAVESAGKIGWTDIDSGEIVVNLTPPSKSQMKNLQLELVQEYVDLSTQ